MSYNYQDAPRESQQEYFGKVHTDNKETLNNALKRIEELEAQIEKMKCCQNCDHYRWSNGDDWCNDHYGQPMYDEECKEKWKLRR